MSDVDRLKEVVDRATVQVEHGIPLMPSVAHALLAAARLLVAGQPLWRCETHDAPGGPRDGGPFDDRCYEWWLNEGIPEAPTLTNCRMVEGVWVPTGKDET